MAIAFRSYASAVATSGGSLEIAKPTGAVEHDALIAVLWGKADEYPYFNTPSGWARVGTMHTEINPNNVAAVFYKQAGDSEGSAYTFTWGQWAYVDGQWTYLSEAPANPYIQGTIAAYSGCNTAIGVLDTYSYATDFMGGDGDIESASVTTTVDNAMLINVACVRITSSASITPPSGMAERIELSQTAVDQYYLIHLSDVVQAAAGASGTKVATATANPVRERAYLLALVPTVDQNVSPSALAATATIGTPSVGGPIVSLVTPTDGAIMAGLTPTFTFGTANLDGTDVHISLEVSAFPDFRTPIIDTDSATDYANWEEAASPFSSWSTVGSGGATPGNRVRYASSETFRYDNYYGRVWLTDAGSQTGLVVTFDFTTAPDSAAPLAVTLGGTTFYPTGAFRITEETGGEASVIDCDINLAQYLAHPLTKGDVIAVASGIGGHARTWNGTVEAWTFDGTVVHIHGLQDDAYLSRKVCTGNEASADLGQNLADFVTTYGAPLTGTNIDTSTGMTMALTGGYKYLREHFTEALVALPDFIYWADDTGDVHLVSQNSLTFASLRLYEEDPSA